MLLLAVAGPSSDSFIWLSVANNVNQRYGSDIIYSCLPRPRNHSQACVCVSHSWCIICSLFCWELSVCSYAFIHILPASSFLWLYSMNHHRKDMNSTGKIVEFGKSCSNKFYTKHDNFDERGKWDGGIDTNVWVWPYKCNESMKGIFMNFTSENIHTNWFQISYNVFKCLKCVVETLSINRFDCNEVNWITDTHNLLRFFRLLLWMQLE